MSDSILRCFLCRDVLDPHADAAGVELNPQGGGREGFHRGAVCPDCEHDLVEKMKNTTGGNV